MYRIHYAERGVTDARPKDDPDNIFVAAEIPESFAYYTHKIDAFRQAVNDLYHGKIVLGVESKRGGIVFTVQELTAALARAQKEIAKFEARGFGPKASRQVVMRELKP